MTFTWVILGGLSILLFSILPPWRSSFADPGMTIDPLISDGQFVWGPNVGDFNVHTFLSEIESPLLAFAEDIENWAAYTSINPRVFLTALEIQTGWLKAPSINVETDVVLAQIENTAMDLTTAFYEHLYLWGSRRSSETQSQSENPSFTFLEGESIRLNPYISSATYAIGNLLAANQKFSAWSESVSSRSPHGFVETFAGLFPNINALDGSFSINPDDLPADDFLQLPFPMGADWTFNGTHSWNGGDLGPDRSSMDFSTNWPKGTELPDDFAVSAHAGNAYVRTPSRTNLPCWTEIHYEAQPGEIWTTSYYHLRFLGEPGDRGWIGRNQSVGAIGAEVCNGGFASGAHVHFTLKYNGAFFDLDGVKLSGWTVSSGPDPYYSGYIERDGVTLSPYARLINDYHEYFGNGLDFALYFAGDTQDGGNQLRIQIDDPDQDTPGPPADVGFHDFVVEWWMKVEPGSNNAPDITCGANDNWKEGNILFDRSRPLPGSEWGVSIVGGHIALGVRGDGSGEITLCSATTIDDGNWHHIAVQRNRWDGTYPDGQLWIFIDGVEQAAALGPRGDISYPNNAEAGEACGPSPTEECVNLDPFLVIGGGKDETDSGFVGLLDNIRFSWWLRYLAGFVPIPGFQSSDNQTVGFLRFNEGQGNLIYDTGGFNGGTSNAIRIFGGAPLGPNWVISELSTYYQVFIPLYLVDQPQAE